MDSDQIKPLTVEEAKARLRAVAQEVTLSKLIEGHSLRYLALALAGGFIVARVRPTLRLGSFALFRLAPILLMSFLRKRRQAQQ